MSRIALLLLLLWGFGMYLHASMGVFPLQTIDALLEVLGGLQHIHLLLPFRHHPLVQPLRTATSCHYA